MSDPIQRSVLVVDDDRKLVAYICEYLERYEFATLRAHNGTEAVDSITTHQPAVVVLDLMMPGIDGIRVCQQVRPDYTGSILMLTGIDDDIDQVAAIEVGVDDYVIKPVQLRVLLARIRMLLRRGCGVANDPVQAQFRSTRESGPPTHTELQFGVLRVSKRERRAYLAEQSLELTAGEFDLLWILAQHPEDILTREKLLKSLRGIDYDGVDRSIDTRIVGLRKKLGDTRAQPSRIITVRGRGYMFNPDAWDTP